MPIAVYRGDHVAFLDACLFRRRPLGNTVYRELVPVFESGYQRNATHIVFGNPRPGYRTEQEAAVGVVHCKHVSPPHPSPDDAEDALVIEGAGGLGRQMHRRIGGS